ncbi:MAG: family 31 glucosidase, partial [Mixta sp.]
FYHYSQQPESWQVEDQYLLGRDLLVAPVLHAGQRERRIWLPAGDRWIARCGTQYQGGQWLTVETPLEVIPVLARAEADPELVAAIRL